MAETKETTGDKEKPEGTGTGEQSGGTPPGNSQGANGAPSGSGTGGADGSSEEIRKVVREEIAEALKTIRQGGNGDGTPGTATRVNLEAEAERMVREATAKLEAEKQHKADHEKLRTPDQKPAETAPKKQRRLTRALWGSDDK